ncbi:HEAT repeat domain containing protein [Entamoeba histolytica HM-3:IMSS]|uniref:HEAT repeat domain containing protein n=1 Tax=Entamoeba histolytica HM-3:IMSS TaxID=885315 RepID=M7W0T2_ENTHI|nr:HEAT repeat domain containing protein [Entamoeba histolytica HM-3:IMSS]
MEFRSIPKPIASEDIELVNGEKFINDFDSFCNLEDANKRLPSIRKTGEAARFLFSPTQCKEFVSKLVKEIEKEETVSIKVIAIQQLIYFIEKCHSENINLYNELYGLMKELVKDETEEIALAAKDVMKKLGEYLNEDKEIEEYLDQVDSLIGNVDGFISSIGLDLLNYFAAKSSKENVKKFIFNRLKKMSQSIQFIMRKGAVTTFPAILSNIEEEDIPEVLSIFDELSKDSVYSVRKTCVVVLNQILNIFTNNKPKVLEYIIQFIEDNSRYVRFQVIVNFGKFIQFIGKDLINQKIIDFFNNNCGNEADSEQQYYAAYYFVTLIQTIGGNQWNLVADSFSKLALSIHWKNRKCIASSLHLLAHEVGNEITMSYLIPALDKYSYSYKNAIPDWRIRKSIAKQLGLLAQSTPMYSSYVEEICVALHVVDVGASSLIQKLTDMSKDPMKVRRVDFVTVATSLFVALPPDQFNPYILPSLELASKDKVSEIRIAVATNIKKVMEKHEHYNDEIKKLSEQLKQDEDVDVKFIMENGPIELFKRKKTITPVVEDPCERIVSFEGFGRK